MSGDRRHLDADALEQYLGQGTPFALAVDGPVPVRLVYDPVEQRLGVELPWDGREPDPLDRYVNLTSAVVVRDGTARLQLWVAGREHLREGYALLRSVADRVQLAGRPSTEAIAEAVDALGDLLARSGRLTEDAEVGLFGELLVLEHLVGTLGATAAASAWKGSRREEHDFGLPNGDVEVKTTLGEERRHWIHGKGQLRPSPGRPLHLVSVQVTDAGAAGRSLTDLVSDVLGVLPQADATTVRSGLARNGWHQEQSHRYVRRLQPRSRPRAYLVDASFPVLDDEALARAGLTEGAVRDLNYLLDLAGVTPTDAVPAPLQPLVVAVGADASKG